MRERQLQKSRTNASRKRFLHSAISAPSDAPIPIILSSWNSFTGISYHSNCSSVSKICNTDLPILFLPTKVSLHLKVCCSSLDSRRTARYPNHLPYRHRGRTTGGILFPPQLPITRFSVRNNSSHKPTIYHLEYTCEKHDVLQETRNRVMEPSNPRTERPWTLTMAAIF